MAQSRPLRLRERLAKMTPDELRAACRATAEGDRTHRAPYLAQINDDRGEVLDLLLEGLDALDAAEEELERRGH